MAYRVSPQKKVLHFELIFWEKYFFNLYKTNFILTLFWGNLQNF